MDPMLRPPSACSNRNDMVAENHGSLDEYATAMLLLSVVFDDFAFINFAHRAAVATVESHHFASVSSGSGIQHAAFVHYQYELATSIPANRRT